MLQSPSITATCFELTCKACRTTLPAPSGSLFWTREELDLAREKGARKCYSCGMALRIPKKL